MMIVKVRVTPNTKEARVVKINDTSFDVRVDEKAVDGRANKRLIMILSDYFNVRKSKISIVKGIKSRDKLVQIVLEDENISAVNYRGKTKK
jgi:hypothetical protein